MSNRTTDNIEPEVDYAGTKYDAEYQALVRQYERVIAGEFEARFSSPEVRAAERELYEAVVTREAGIFKEKFTLEDASDGVLDKETGEIDYGDDWVKIRDGHATSTVVDGDVDYSEDWQRLRDDEKGENPEIDEHGLDLETGHRIEMVGPMELVDQLEAEAADLEEYAEERTYDTSVELEAAIKTRDAQVADLQWLREKQKEDWKPLENLHAAEVDGFSDVNEKIEKPVEAVIDAREDRMTQHASDRAAMQSAKLHEKEEMFAEHALEREGEPSVGELRAKLNSIEKLANSEFDDPHQNELSESDINAGSTDERVYNRLRDDAQSQAIINRDKQAGLQNANEKKASVLTRAADFNDRYLEALEVLDQLNAEGADIITAHGRVQAGVDAADADLTSTVGYNGSDLQELRDVAREYSALPDAERQLGAKVDLGIDRTPDELEVG